MKSYNFCNFQIGWVKKDSLIISEYDSDIPLAKVFSDLMGMERSRCDLLLLRDSIKLRSKTTCTKLKN